jgi:hypothetical protein
MSAATQKAPEVGQRAPDFFVDTPSGRKSICKLAAQHGKLVLVSLDSYRYHPG